MNFTYLENLNLVELKAEETFDVEGGWVGVFLVAVAWSAWENVGDIRAGWEDGKTGAARY